jgi:hypothetical protein
MTWLFMALSSASLGDWASAGARAIAARADSSNDLNARRRIGGLNPFRIEQSEQLSWLDTKKQG